VTDTLRPQFIEHKTQAVGFNEVVSIGLSNSVVISVPFLITRSHHSASSTGFFIKLIKLAISACAAICYAASVLDLPPFTKAEQPKLKSATANDWAENTDTIEGIST